MRRAKGLVDLEGHGPSIVHYAADILSWEPAEQNSLGKFNTTGSFLVVIGRNLNNPRDPMLKKEN